MRKSLICVAMVAAIGGAGAAAWADETTACNAYVTSLPYTITKQGHYCFDRNLSTAITSGAAINVSADFVVLDLNNFKLGGGAAGPASNAIGIASVNHRNITIRNGNIRGFGTGIVLLDEGNGGRHLIEDNLVEGSLDEGIVVEGDGVVIRRNRVLDTGKPGATSSIAIDASLGTVLAHDNFVFNVFGGSLFNEGVRIGIDFGIAKDNVVRFETGTTNPTGIVANVCRGNTVIGAPSNLCTNVVTGDAIVP